MERDCKIGLEFEEYMWVGRFERGRVEFRGRILA